MSALQNYTENSTILSDLSLESVPHGLCVVLLHFLVCYCTDLQILLDIVHILI